MREHVCASAYYGIKELLLNKFNKYWLLDTQNINVNIGTWVCLHAMGAAILDHVTSDLTWGHHASWACHALQNGDFGNYSRHKIEKHFHAVWNPKILTL